MRCRPRWRLHGKITNSAKYIDKCMEQKVGLQPGEPGGRHSFCFSALAAECEARDSEMLSHGCQYLSPSQTGGKKPKQTHDKVKEIRGTEQ